jgi:hypothetical protein
MTQFHDTADAHFDATRGTGRRNEDRDCTLTFVKQYVDRGISRGGHSSTNGPPDALSVLK